MSTELLRCTVSYIVDVERGLANNILSLEMAMVPLDFYFFEKTFQL
jgi:hypothetical protein